MPTTIRDFHIGLYREHLEEASFLYAQRRALFAADELPWTALASFEDRLEAHIDALVVGDGLALEVCSDRCEVGDEGELFACVGVFCRRSRADLVAGAIHGIAPQQAERIAAVTAALKDELPPSWTEFAERALFRGDPKLTSILARVAAYRRLPVTGALQCFGAVRGPQSDAVVAALGRLRCSDARALLEEWLREPIDSVRTAALLALLRIGVDAPLAALCELDPHATWPSIGLALSGNQATARALASRPGRLCPDQLLAIGLLGDPQSIAPLHRYLSVPALAETAALALHWITGAPLHADVFVEEKLHEDEMFDEELKAWKAKGTMPRRPDGAAYGETRRRLSTDPQQWESWLSQHLGSFDANRRYRSGRPITPGVLLDNLANPGSDRRLREFVAEELAIRYGCDVPFETDMPVAQQLCALRQVKQWVDAHAQRFEQGRWYFAEAVQ